MLIPSLAAATRRTLPACAAILAGCASGGAQHAYVAPTFETIVSRTEERQSDPPEHVIFIENHSTVPVTVFSVSLTGCENVKPQLCSVHPTSTRLTPGQRQIVTRVAPEDKFRAFSYHFGFSWRADSGVVSALAALARSGDEGARARLAEIQGPDSIVRQ